MKKYIPPKVHFLTGTSFFTLAGILTRIIGFFYRIFLSRTIGAEGLGIYQLIAPVTAICFAFTAAGIQTSISKFVSMEVGRKNDAGAKTYLSIGLFISLCLSTLCSLFLYHYADFIAVSWLGDKRCTPLLAVLSFSFIPCCIHACINGYYYGLKKNGCPFTLPVDRTVRPRWKRLSDVPDRRQRRKIFNAFHGRLGNRLRRGGEHTGIGQCFPDLRWKPAHPRQKQEKSLYLHQKSALHGSSLNLKQDRSKFICRV